MTSGFELDGKLGVGELRTAAMPARPAGARGEREWDRCGLDRVEERDGGGRVG